MTVCLANLCTYEILDSRGYPTLSITLTTNTGVSASSMVPAGASIGQREALEHRDGGTRYLGKGVQQACHTLRHTLWPILKDQPMMPLKAFDQQLCALDNAPNKQRYGANTLLALSMAYARLQAQLIDIPLFQYINTLVHQPTPITLPVPLINVINGGAHADNTLDIQEFMIIPLGLDTFQAALEASFCVIQALRHRLKQQGHTVLLGDEGGFAPNVSHEQALDLLCDSITACGFTLGTHIALGLDVAASGYFHEQRYYFNRSHQSYSPSEWVEKLTHYTKNYPIISIEDGMADTDTQGWQWLTQALGQNVQLVGDDLLATQKIWLQEAITHRMANAMVVKYNQVGTLSETLDVVAYARDHHYTCVVSHRSGDTEDAFLADFALGINAPQVKFGSLAHSERLAKYNRLLCLAQHYAMPYGQSHAFHGKT
jgi:enolase